MLPGMDLTTHAADRIGLLGTVETVRRVRGSGAFPHGVAH